MKVMVSMEQKKLINSFSIFYLLVAILMGGIEATLAGVVESHPRNISVKLFCNPTIGLRGDVV